MNDDQAPPALPDDADPVDPVALRAALEYDTTSSFHRRAAVFRRIHEYHVSHGDNEQAARAEWFQILFSWDVVARTGGQRATGKGRFQPLVAGETWEFPNHDLLPDRALDAFADELKTATNPIHRALLADYLWHRRRDYRAAQTAVEAYLESVPLYDDDDGGHDVVDALDRAAEISLEINDNKRWDQVRVQIIRNAKRLVDAKAHPQVRWALDLLAILQALDKRASASDHEFIVEFAERGASFYESECDEHLQRSFLELLPRSLRRVDRANDADLATRRRAQTFEAQAERSEGGILRSHWLEQAIQAYADIGDTVKIDELKVQLEDAGRKALGEMITISSEANFDRTVIERRLTYLRSMSPTEALAAVAEGEWFVPRLAAVRVVAERQRASHPLQHLMPRKTLNEKGQIVAQAETAEERILVSELDTYLLWAGVADLELAEVLDELEFTRGLDASTLMDFLRASPVSEETLDAVAVGIDRYFSHDYVSALHVLVTQLEDGLRDVLEGLGQPRTSIQLGVQREKPLDVVLGDPAMVTQLGTDFIRYLEIQLIEQRGPNLRHRIAHGLLKPKACTRTAVQRVLYCFLLLAARGQSRRDGATVEFPSPEEC